MSTTQTPPIGSKPPPGEVPRNVRILQFVVVALGIVLILGMATVIGRIAYLMMRPANQAISSSPYPNPEIPAELSIPGLAKVISTSLQGSHLSVHYSGPSGDGIAIVDLHSRQVIRRISVIPAGAKDASVPTGPAKKE